MERMKVVSEDIPRPLQKSVSATQRHLPASSRSLRHFTTRLPKTSLAGQVHKGSNSKSIMFKDKI